MSSHDLTDLPGAIGSLGPDAFERFCQELVEVEAFSRQNLKDLRIEGPAAPQAPDGGRDVLLSCVGPPEKDKTSFERQYKVHALTEDPAPGVKLRTVYNCKTGDWLDLVRRDIKKHPGRALDVLKEGGYFRVLINCPGLLDGTLLRDHAKNEQKVEATPVEHIVAWFAELLPDATDLKDRIQILDVNDLARFVRQVDGASQVLDRWADQLEVRDPLLGVEDWEKHHESERAEPVFQTDTLRSSISAEVKSWIAAAQSSPALRVGWLVGAPGVGKTRLVLETLSDPVITGRARIAITPKKAEEAIDGGLLGRRQNCILVVDDATPDEVSALAAKFRAKQNSASADGARLIALTPASPDQVAPDDRIKNRWNLDALDDDSIRRIVGAELRQPVDAAPVTEITKIVEGYPWFAVLVAKEAIEQGRPPSSMKEAVDWALVPKSEATGEALAARLRLRTQTLLAAILASGTDWERELDEPAQAQLAKAVQVDSWNLIRDDAKTAVHRGLLRLREGWKYKYVTPAVLEREVIKRALGSPPTGSDPGGRALQRHGGRYLDAFIERIQRLKIPKEILDSVARIAVDSLAAQKNPDDFAAGTVQGALLLLACSQLPEPTARALDRLVSGTSLATLAERFDVRRDLVFALHQLGATSSGFDLAEPALFRLALAENEAYVNNASGAWATLFSVELNQTYRTLDARMALLERRLESTDAASRKLALTAVNAMFSTSIVRAVSPSEGPWPTPTVQEAQNARAQAITLAAKRLSDADESVAAAARSLFVRELRSFVRSGHGQLALLLVRERIRGFSETDQSAFSESLEMLRAYDLAFLDEAGRTELELLEAVLSPKTFHERLHRSLAGWGPAALRDEMEVADGQLAEESLTGETPLIVTEIDWLLSREAKRARSFAWSLGLVDRSLTLFELLRVRLPDRRVVELLSVYLSGIKSKYPDAARSALAVLQESAPANVFVACVMAAGADDETCAVVTRLLLEQRWTVEDVEGFARPSWLADVSDARAIALYDALLTRGPGGARIVIEAISSRLHTGGVLAPFGAIAARAVVTGVPSDLGGLVEHNWARVADALLEVGDVTPVAAAAVQAIAVSGSNLHETWRVLQNAASRDSELTWQHLVPVLERRDPQTGKLLLSFQFGRIAIALPVESVLAWVGNDEQRARALTSLIGSKTATINPILRALIIRFGANSSVSRAVIARLHSTERAVPSLPGHDEETLELVKRWSDDEDATIRSFVERALASLRESRDKHAAYEDHERRRFGT